MTTATTTRTRRRIRCHDHQQQLTSFTTKPTQWINLILFMMMWIYLLSIHHHQVVGVVSFSPGNVAIRPIGGGGCGFFVVNRSCRDHTNHRCQKTTPRRTLQQPSSPSLLKATAANSGGEGWWYPRRSSSTTEDALLDDDDGSYTTTTTSEEDYDDDDDDVRIAELIEDRAVKLVAKLVRRRLDDNNNIIIETNSIPKEVKGRFMDLTCDVSGERALESLFAMSNESNDVDDDDDLKISEQSTEVTQAAVMVLQSLCVMGTCAGLKGPPDQLKRMVAHLDSRNDPTLLRRDLLECWDSDSVRRLKFRLDRNPAIQLLSELLWKRAPQGAFDLLVAIGAWRQHEDLALIRSGFPLRFTESELAAARRVSSSGSTSANTDVDDLLGIRKDMKSMKVYTIDSASTIEIDDGLSIEVLRDNSTNDDNTGGGGERHRIWIHIADVDRWADEELFKIAKKRVTSLYLPSGSYPMFPSSVSTELMSLRANKDACTLSLGVELNDDGSVHEDSVIVVPSFVRVSYRLTYDDVDEMLEEGTGYSEEWELGALLDAAIKRRKYRIRNGSTEGLVPKQIPFATVSTYPDKNAPDGIGISHSVQVSHNSGRNQTEVDAADDENDESTPSSSAPAPLSSSYLLVTEMMILAGEAVGHWKRKVEEERDDAVNGSAGGWPNQVPLPFRTQKQPDFKSRSRERRIMMDLLEYNVGNGLCHAWYMRRFLQSVKVTEFQYPHSGLGLSSYVQWSSPIRRCTDYLVHIAVKRYLRRERAYKLMEEGSRLHADITDRDLGLPIGTIKDGKLPEQPIAADDLNQDINYLEGLGLVGAARTLQRQSQQYWMYEYIRRAVAEDSNRVYSAVVLGCVDPARRQYAIYLPELGLEHRYTSPGGRLDSGATLQLRVDNVSPRFSNLSFVRVV